MSLDDLPRQIRPGRGATVIRPEFQGLIKRVTIRSWWTKGPRSIALKIGLLRFAFEHGRFSGWTSSYDVIGEHVVGHFQFATTASKYASHLVLVAVFAASRRMAVATVESERSIGI